MIKLGYRKNMLHPIVLLICTVLRRTIQIVITTYFNMGQFILSGLIFLSTFVFGFLAYKLFFNKKTIIAFITLLG